jgi:hypothetical protein
MFRDKKNKYKEIAMYFIEEIKRDIKQICPRDSLGENFVLSK